MTSHNKDHRGSVLENPHKLIWPEDSYGLHMSGGRDVRTAFPEFTKAEDFLVPSPTPNASPKQAHSEQQTQIQLQYV